MSDQATKTLLAPEPSAGVKAIPILLVPYAKTGESIPRAWKCYESACDATLPQVYRTATGRLRVPLSALPEIARFFGLTGRPTGAAAATAVPEPEPKHNKRAAPAARG